jgi:hypothetical protein
MIPEEMLLKAREKAYVALIKIADPGDTGVPWDVRLQAASLLLAASERDIWLGVQATEGEPEDEGPDILASSEGEPVGATMG